MASSLTGRIVSYILLGVFTLSVCGGSLWAQHGSGGSRLSDEVLPPQVDLVPERPAPLLEFGDPFYKTGPIGRGFRLPTGAVVAAFADFLRSVSDGGAGE